MESLLDKRLDTVGWATRDEADSSVYGYEWKDATFKWMTEVNQQLSYLTRMIQELKERLDGEPQLSQN